MPIRSLIFVKCPNLEKIDALKNAIAKENVFACQFHPEKSQENGLRLFETFSRV